MKLIAVAMAMLFFAMQSEAAVENGWPLWNSYAGHFISHEGRVIDPDRNEMTTSEGQSYAMFFALVANDAATFEKLRAWTEDNLAKGDLKKNLPSWSWGKKSDDSWGVLDENSASDSDLWIAYDLLQAGVLWKKQSYSLMGHALLSNIAWKEVAQLPGVGPVLLPGRTELFSDVKANRWIVNPSYLPLPLLVSLGAHSPGGPWKQMAALLPGLLQKASPSGFAMDWVAYDGKSFSASANPGNASQTARGSYDAIRVYLWAGMTNADTPGASQILAIYTPMARFLRSSMMPPEVESPEGQVLSNNAPPGFSAALVPFLASSGEKTSAAMQLRQVQARLDQQTGLLGTPPRYYDQNLALFALGWQEQRFRFAPDGTLRVRWKN